MHLPFVTHTPVIRGFLVVVGLMLAHPVSAQVSWGSAGAGGDGTWNYLPENKNWFTGTTDRAWRITDTSAVFGGAAGTVSIGSAITVSSLSFTTAGYTLQGASEAALLATTAPSFTVDNSGTTTLNVSAITGTGSAVFVKTGSGLLATSAVLVGFAAVDVQGGELAFNGAVFEGAGLAFQFSNTTPATLSFDVATTLPTVGSLAGGTTGTVIRSGGVTDQFLTIAGVADASFAGSLQDNGSASLALTKMGSSRQTLTAANTYSGVTLVSGGTLALAGDASLTATPSITLASGGILELDNTAASLANRVSDTTEMYSTGGAVRFIGNGSTGSAETIGALTLAAGVTTVDVDAAEGQSAALTFAALFRPNAGSLLRFSGDGSTTLTGASNFNGILGGWAVVGDNWAAIDGAKQVGAFSGYTTSLTSGASTDNVKLSASQTLAAATTTRNTLALDTGAGEVAIDVGGASNTLRLNAGGLLVTGTNAAAINNGRLTSNALTHELVVVNRADLAIGAAIVNTTAALSLTKAGEGTLTLSGANTYSGNTYLLEGTLVAATGSAIPDTSSLTISQGATFRLNSSSETIGNLNGAGLIDVQSGQLVVNGSGTFGGVITGSGGLTKSGEGALTLTGAQTYTGHTRVEGGSLLFVDDGIDVLPDGNALTLAGGTFGVSSATLSLTSETVGSLTLASDSLLQFHVSTTLGSVLAFADSSAASWNGLLYVTGYTDVIDSLRFGTDAHGLTAEQLGSLFFVTDTGYLTAQIDALGFVTPTPVPEPSTYALLLGSGALLLTMRRVRRMRR